MNPSYSTLDPYQKSIRCEEYFGAKSVRPKDEFGPRTLGQTLMQAAWGQDIVFDEKTQSRLNMLPGLSAPPKFSKTYHDSDRFMSKLADAEARDDASKLQITLAKLKAYAVQKKLDMTDAMDEFCGAGVEKNLGLMDRQG